MIRVLQKSSILFNKTSVNFIKYGQLTKSISICSPINLSKSKTEDEAKLFNETALNQNLPVIVRPSMFTRLKESFGFQGSHRYTQHKMEMSAARLYLCIQKQVDYDKFFQVCQARDVFFSFILVTYLHIWMLSVRLAQEGHSGEFVIKRLIEGMWADIANRMKKLARINSKVKQKTYEELNEIFRGCLCGYDEGILSNDCVLSGAIWRHLLEMRDIEDYASLNKLVEYVRKNVAHLDNINEKDVLFHGIVTFVDFDIDSLDHLKEREKHIKYLIELEA